MNRTRTSKNAKRLLVWLLLTMVFGLLPMAAFADDTGEPVVSEEPVQEPEPSSEPSAKPSQEPEEDPMDEPSDEESTDEEPVDEEEEVVVARYTGNDGFLRIFHLDCGRKYFSVSDIEQIIDKLAENNYTHIQLAFGNNGFRFLLGNMEITLDNGTKYTDQQVRNAIISGNNSYSSNKGADASMLSESDMTGIISYAKGKGIGVIPMLNTPGHMDALVSAMNMIGIRSSAGSEMSLTSDKEVEFIKALQQKYITYFASQGCDHYNLAADEYSFGGLNNEEYTAFAQYVNDIAKMVKQANMTPMAYNDGIYYGEKVTTVPFDTAIQICYWTQDTNYASAVELSSRGFAIINNNNAWYYVLGDYLYEAWSSGQWGYASAMDGIENTKVTEVKNAAGQVTPVGSVLCCWCDGPSIEFDGTCVRNGTAPSGQTNRESVYKLIEAMAEANPDYFGAPVSTEPELAVVNSDETTVAPAKQSDGSYKVTAKADDTVKLEVTNIGETAEPVWTTDNEAVAAVDQNGKVTFTGAAGTVTITASLDNGTVLTATFVVPEDTGEEEYTEEKDYTLYVGGTEKVTINGKNLNADGKTYKTADESIATVTVDGKDATESSEVYTQTSAITCRTLAGGETSARDTGYYYEADDGNYYPVWAYRKSSGLFSYKYYVFYYNASNTKTMLFYEETNGSQSIKLYEKSTKDGTPASTTIIFTGIAVGDTYAIIDGVKYNIHVIPESLENAEDLPIQLWITNVSIEVTGVTTKSSGQFNDYNNGGYAEYVSVKAEDAYGQQGVALSELVPPAVKNKTETTIDDRDATYSIWKGTVLNTTTGLQKYWWNDMTKADGRVDYQYVRYYGGNWAVSNDRVSWTTVTGEGSTGPPTGCKEQVIAYYMQRTDVTNEIITDVVDWGNTTDKWATNKPTQYVVLDFAVQYPDHKSPDSFPQTGKTVYFHCSESDTNVVSKDDDGNYYRRIGLIKGIDTTNYEVYMITVTPTSDTVTDQLTDSRTALTTDITIEYNGTEKVAWVDDEANLPASFRGDDVKFHSISGSFNYTVGGEPNVAGLETYQRQGMLVTYYLRAKVTADTLYVHYIDKVANKEFYSYPINVIAEETPGFKEGIGLGNPWKGPLVNGDVKNDEGVTQTVSADLSKMPAIGAQYRFGNYTCVDVTCDGNRKDVYLYYVFTPEKTFVVDFGLTLNIKPTDVSSELANANITGVQYDKSYYATITEGADYSINYTLNKTIDGVDNFQVVYKGINLYTKEDGTATFTISIIPASNVYYEDSFAKVNDGKGVASTAIWERTTNDTSARQALSELGKAPDSVYGYDSAYANNTQYSMNGYSKVTVTSAMASDTWDANNDAWPTATFSFKGTGFDVISLTNNTSGAILVDVYNSANEKVKGYFVDNYFGYGKNATGEWVKMPDGGDNILYQIPVIKVSDLTYDNYNVTITVFYNDAFEHNGDSSYDFWLDAIRVYEPLGPSGNDSYKVDGEGYPQYIRLHDEIVKEGSSVGTSALFIEGDKVASVAEYTNLGPNNEVYLANGQAISFKLSTNDKIDKVQIGAKAPTGTTGITVNNDENVVAISSATEMYYDITAVAKVGQVTITNTSGNILSLTNIKVTFSEDNEVTLVALDDAAKENAVEIVRTLFAAPVVEPEKTFEPSRFKATWSKNVRAGERAVLTVKTSEDVESITVNGVPVTTYKTRTERNGWGRKRAACDIPRVHLHDFCCTECGLYCNRSQCRGNKQCSADCLA